MLPIKRKSMADKSENTTQLAAAYKKKIHQNSHDKPRLNSYQYLVYTYIHISK